MKLSSMLVPALLASLALGLTSYAFASASALTVPIASTASSIVLTPMVSQRQGIIGNATIEFVSPFCTPGTPPAPASGPELVITPRSVRILVVAISWSLISGCVLFASFQVALIPGTYSVTLSPCNYPVSCSHLPKTVTVRPGVFTPVVITIITGIF